jgi:DNA ligase (NAD+)
MVSRRFCGRLQRCCVDGKVEFGALRQTTGQSRNVLPAMLKAIANLFTLALGRSADARKVFHPTDKCPECGTALMQPDGGNWRCPNLDCPAQLRARLLHWCSSAALNIAGGDAALVAQLVDHGLAYDAAELYRIKVAELAALPGRDKLFAQNFFAAVTASQKRAAWRTLSGLGIPNVGPDEAKSLCRHFASVDNVFAASVERLMKAKDVGAATARSLVHWHSDSVNRKLVKRLRKAGVNFRAELYPAT